MSPHLSPIPRALAGFMALTLAVPRGSAAGEAPPQDRHAPPRAAESELRDVVQWYAADQAALERRYPVAQSPERFARLKTFYADWQSQADALPFDSLGVEGRLDHLLLRNRLEVERKQLEREEARLSEAAPLLPFAPAMHALNDARLRVDPLDPAEAAASLDALAMRIEDTRKAVEAGASTSPPKNAPVLKPSRLVAFRAQEAVSELKAVLESWHAFYAGYDPLFSWWTAVPHTKTTRSLDAYRTALREKVLGLKPGEDDPIVGTPIGRDALASDLASEFIPYAPEELLAIADRELAWCESEIKKAARQMGFGEDWKAALEKVKTLHVPPGQQPGLVRDLAREAVAYLKQHDLVTVPPLAEEIWRVEMLSPEEQKVSPFFLGGEVIQVAFPTDAMSQADKLMSLRGNNIHFARATVFHELIPGHHLQGFMSARYNPQRREFRTPFWTEGWALYWEMLLWDMGFPQTPENRVGMLFWRMHRAARIVFSLRFHLGTMSPQECIDFLVERVGHERANASAEVRRSFNGSFPPLYQLAYMIGGLQFRALHAELVDSGRMTNRAFHDAVLTGGSMPVELVRARLLEQPLPRDYRPRWKFAAAPAAARE